MERTPFPDLTPVQVQVALSLAVGKSLTTAAVDANVGRTTIYTWLKENSAFAEAVDCAKTEFVATLRDRLRDATIRALVTLTTLMDDPKAPAGVRLKAALALLNRPQASDQEWLRHLSPEAPLNKTEQNGTLFSRFPAVPPRTP